MNISVCQATSRISGNNDENSACLCVDIQQTMTTCIMHASSFHYIPPVYSHCPKFYSEKPSGSGKIQVFKPYITGYLAYFQCMLPHYV